MSNKPDIDEAAFTTSDLPTEPVTIASILATLDEVGASWTSTAEPDPDSLGARLTAAGGSVTVGADGCSIVVAVPGNRPDLAVEVAEMSADRLHMCSPA